MKLATLNEGGRDGRLLIVSKDLRHAVRAEAAPTLQVALDHWTETAPLLAAQASALADERIGDVFNFTSKACMAPLPRAYHWADGSAYVNHVELVRKARGVDMPVSFWTDPLMYQGGSDAFLGPCEPIRVADEVFGIDMEAEVAVITDDVPMGVSAADAAGRIRLLMLVNDVSLRGLIPAELGKGFGFLQSKPSTAFSQIALTPDELGAAWDGKKLHGQLEVDLNDNPLGRTDSGVDMTFDFPTLIAHSAKTRRLCAGAIIGSGTVSNKDVDGGPGKPVAEGGHGYSCLAELRTVETLKHGEAMTPFMRFGDSVRIDMRDEHGRTIFGAIDQVVERNHG